MMKDEEDFTKDNYSGRNIWFGVREFAMGAALNGMALHGGLKVYGATFFVFSDYLRPAVRLSAIMNAPVTYVFTHDSVAVGEDGPTHEPVEHLASLRAMPNLNVIRPADGYETNAAWELSLETDNRPTSLVLTRKGLPTLENTKQLAKEGVRKGAYVLSDSEGTPDVILLASGSEVSLAIDAQKALKEDNIQARVVSMPSWNLFDEQDEAYKESVLPSAVKARVAIEMGSSLGWHKYTGLEGTVVGIDRFGASGNGSEIVKEFGFTVENVVTNVKNILA